MGKYTAQGPDNLVVLVEQEECQGCTLLQAAHIDRRTGGEDEGHDYDFLT
jgi:hypothetical protein